MRYKKVYGQSKKEECPFCGEPGLLKNPQGVPVCKAHQSQRLPDIKCVCGEYLDLFEGKWGPYFRCLNCGNHSFRKGLSMGKIMPADDSSKPDGGNKQDDSQETPVKRRETTIRSDQLDAYFG